MVGKCYYEGWGVAKDDAEAVRLWRLSAAQGYAMGQNNLGCMFRDGQGVAKDDAEAVRLYRLSAEQGHAGAQYNLAAKVLRRTEQKPSDATASPPRRGRKMPPQL